MLENMVDEKKIDIEKKCIDFVNNEIHGNIYDLDACIIHVNNKFKDAFKIVVLIIKFNLH